MAANDTLCFADFDPVTGAPQIDGNVQPDPGVTTAEAIERGYVNGSRLTLGGSGFPPVAFQGVRSGNNLVLGFFCRGDFSFDGGGTLTGGDVVVLALRPSQANSDQSTARRFDIFPVWEGIGAEEQSSGNPASPANTPDDFAGFAVRTNHHARRIDFYKGQAAGAPWTPPTVPAITGLDVKVRSWLPPIASQTVTVGTQSSGNTTLNVFSTAAFASSGQLALAGTLVAYTGTTATSFTGCSTKRAAVALPDGTAVATAECAWSIEVQLPITGGGADWINLADGFGLYFDIIRLGRAAVSGSTPSQTWFSTQFRFPAGVTGNALTGILDESTVIDPAWYGTGLIPALQVPPGTNRGLGVKFTNDELSVGRRTLGSTTTTLDHEIQGPAGTSDNEIVSLLSNTGASAAAGVTATIRVANWGLGPAVFTEWDLPIGMSNNPSAPQPVLAGASNVAFISPWPRASVPSDYGSVKHQCIWVQLDSGATVNFVQSSVRRNMDFVGFSEVDRDAEISGVGYPAPGPGGHHDFLLFTRARRIVLPRGDKRSLAASETGALLGSSSGGTADVTYLWITEGYRRTRKHLRIGNIDSEVLDEAPGAFGYIGQHSGVDDGLAWEFSGPGLRRDGHVHHLKVPHNGSVVIHTRVRTTAPRPPATPGMARWPWWVWLLIALLVLLLIWALK